MSIGREGKPGFRDASTTVWLLLSEVSENVPSRYSELWHRAGDLGGLFIKLPGASSASPVQWRSLPAVKGGCVH